MKKDNNSVLEGKTQNKGGSILEPLKLFKDYFMLTHYSICLAVSLDLMGNISEFSFDPWIQLAFVVVCGYSTIGCLMWCIDYINEIRQVIGE